jgi:hypothetical protein
MEKFPCGELLDCLGRTGAILPNAMWPSRLSVRSALEEKTIEAGNPRRRDWVQFESRPAPAGGLVPPQCQACVAVSSLPVSNRGCAAPHDVASKPH